MHLRRLRLKAGALIGRLVFTSGKIPAIVTEDELIAALGGKAENLDLTRHSTEPWRG